MSVVTVLVLAVFVMPRFEVFFASLARQIAAGHPHAPQHDLVHGQVVVRRILAVVVIIVGGLMAMRRSPGGKAKLDAFQLKIPVIGDLTETAIIERTCRVLASMLRAGVDLPRSMAVTAESANNAVYRNALEKIREAMMQGQGLAEPIAQSGLFPAAARQMFRVGEETGTLDQQLEVAAAYYGRELETKLEQGDRALRAGDHHLHGRRGRIRGRCPDLGHVRHLQPGQGQLTRGHPNEWFQAGGVAVLGKTHRSSHSSGRDYDRRSHSFTSQILIDYLKRPLLVGYQTD